MTTTAPPWPLAPACHVTTWQKDSRVRLPVMLDPDAQVCVGAVGPGWLELTDREGAPALPVDVKVQTGNRIAIAGRAVIGRFGARPGDLVLVTVSGDSGQRFIRVVAADCLERALREPTLRPARLFSAPGWEKWRRTELGQDGG